MPSAPQLLWTGFQGLDAQAVELPFHPGGLVLFARNLDPDPAQGPRRCHALLQELQARWGQALPLAVALDQEGGPVSRLRPWVGETPPLRRLWELGGAAACQRWGSLWGEGLRILGFNVDFAPVLDLYDGHASAGIGDRAASSDAGETAQAAGAFLHGLESFGVRGCLKHFPGLGGTTLDSHKGLPALAEPERIERNAAPFIALAHPDRLIMVAHLQLPSSGTLPASLHRESVVDNPWGIQGRFLPDDLEMGGCADWSWDERVRQVLAAGHEWLLVCQTPAGWTACAQALSRQPEALWAPALQATRRFRQHLPAPQTTPFEADHWQDWLERLHSAAKED